MIEIAGNQFDCSFQCQFAIRVITLKRNNKNDFLTFFSIDNFPIIKDFWAIFECYT